MLKFSGFSSSSASFRSPISSAPASPPIAEQLSRLLNDPEEFGHYSFNGLMKKIAESEVLALELLKIEAFIDSVDGLGLSLLAGKYLSVAQQIIRNPVLRSKLQPIDFAYVGSRHEAVTRELMQDEEFLLYFKNNIIRGEHIAEMCQNFPELAIYVLSQKIFTLNMDGAHVAKLCEKHLNVALYAYSNEYLRRKADIDDTSLLGQAHEAIAWFMMKDPTMRSFLEGETYARLGRNHEAVSDYILDEKDIRAMGHMGIASMGKNNPVTARKIIEHPFWSKYLDGNSLAVLGQSSGEIAELIYSDDYWRRFLTLEQKIALSKHSLKIGLDIINNPEIRGELKSTHLKFLGMHHHEIALLIMANPDLFKQLGPNDIGYIALSDFQLARDILLQHFKVLGVHSIALLCKRFLGINTIVLNNVSLHSRLTEHYRGLLNMRISTIQAIHKHVASVVYPQPTAGSLSSYTMGDLSNVTEQLEALDLSGMPPVGAQPVIFKYPPRSAPIPIPPRESSSSLSEANRDYLRLTYHSV